jgi:hypothetical protein
MSRPYSPEPKLQDCTCARPGCGVVFPVRKSDLRFRPNPHCSRSCANLHRSSR